MPTYLHAYLKSAGSVDGIESKYLARYLGEYTFRFNRRHDPNSPFHRALTACVNATPSTEHALFR